MRSENHPLLAYYGDDFTGSTDALEAHSFAGLKSVLFTGIPSEERLREFSCYDVIGIAGTSRSRDPAWMENNLPAAFRALAQTGAKVIQYKVCSTFDSSPTVGSIGKAIDIGMSVISSPWSPSIIGIPSLGRWQAFGNLFAAADGHPYRIDRHPTMSRHPVTPMLEADLRVHLSQQTNRPIEVVDFVSLSSNLHASHLASHWRDGRIVFIDVVDSRSQLQAGRTVWEDSSKQLFSASSSGLNHALVAHWRTLGLVASKLPARNQSAKDTNLLVVSGSCSPLTAKQIAHAEVNGFESIRLNVLATADPERHCREIERVTTCARDAFASGKSVVVFAAKTVDDKAFADLRAFCSAKSLSLNEGQRAVGIALGKISALLIEEGGPRRLLVAGGDTSGSVVESMPIYALEATRPFVKGAPICRAYSSNTAFHGLEIILKGGQIGEPNLFEIATRA